MCGFKTVLFLDLSQTRENDCDDENIPYADYFGFFCSACSTPQKESNQKKTDT